MQGTARSLIASKARHSHPSPAKDPAVKHPALIAVAAVVMLTGCASANANPTASGTTGATLTTAPRLTPYALYTHCGIDEANIAGHWYHAVTPLSDGSGNPPPGWDNPYQHGEVLIISDTEVEFRDANGHHVRFTLRPTATGPERLCG
jgi:hypothetical protein